MFGEIIADQLLFGLLPWMFFFFLLRIWLNKRGIIPLLKGETDSKYERKSITDQLLTLLMGVFFAVIFEYGLAYSAAGYALITDQNDILGYLTSDYGESIIYYIESAFIYLAFFFGLWDTYRNRKKKYDEEKWEEEYQKRLIQRYDAQQNESKNI